MNSPTPSTLTPTPDSPAPAPALAPTPAVSIVIPVYNGAHLLDATLQSVFEQTFGDFEILVIDDGSTDSTRELLASYGERIRVFEQQNGGASSARNRGIRHARGEFIAFLDGDDLWDADKLRLQVEALRADPEVGVCSSECVYFDAEKQWPANLLGRTPARGMIFDLLLVDHCISTSAVMVRKSCLDDVGVFDESLIGCEDYNLFLRLARKYPFRFLPQVLVKSRIHASNLSADLPQMCRDEIANLDKIDALYPELHLPIQSLQAGIWFRFGQYHFDNHDFAAARAAFWQSMRRAPSKAASYVYFGAALLPTAVRERGRAVLRAVRSKAKPDSAIEQKDWEAEPKDSNSEQKDWRSGLKDSRAELKDWKAEQKASDSRQKDSNAGQIASRAGKIASPTPVVMVTWSLVAGGSETYALTLAKNLDPTRFAPSLCALDQGGALEAEIRRLQIPYRVMHRRGGVQFRLMVRMFRLFRARKARVVHTHHFNQLFYSLLGAKLCGARLIHTEHSVEAFKRPRLRLALRILALGCHKITAIGEDGARVLREDVGIPAAKLEIIRGGVDLGAFNESREAARREFGLDEGAPVAAIVARLSGEKNHHNLLQAWQSVLKRVPDATLLVAGAGPEEAALRLQIAELGIGNRVQMLGVRRDVARVLAACDIFVLSSDREGLPLSVLEAMAASRAVVATDVGDLGRVVRGGETGLLVPPLDVAALAGALIDLLGDTARAAQFGAAGKIAVAGFGLAPMIEAHERLYSE